MSRRPVHSSNPNPRALALETAISVAHEPFYSGICAIPDYQCLLYYFHNSEDVVRRIDVSKATSNDLDVLYRTCKPAEFGRGKENVLDESYRKAGKMDLDAFATQFDPRSLGVHEQVSKALLPEKHGMTDMELYKLNVYGEGDFFKAHKDTPRDKDMFGSLVVVLPTPHEGGQLVLCQDEKKWTIDFTDNFSKAKSPSVCYIAFYSDVEHEVLPIVSGHRLTLTYNLYRAPTLPATSPIFTPQLVTIKQALADLINDKSTLPNGGYLGFGLMHEYVHTGKDILSLILGQLKGSDRTLADICDALGLRYALRLLYRDVFSHDFTVNLVATRELKLYNETYYEDYRSEMDDPLEEALTGEDLTIEDVEVIDIVGDPHGSGDGIWKKSSFGDPNDSDSETLEKSFLCPQFCRDPPTQVLEITRMKSSLDFKTSFATYGNEVSLEHFYGTACMLVAVDPAASRGLLAV